MTAQTDAEITGFNNGNCLIHDGQRYVGAAVVSNTEITWPKTYLAGMSAQRAELTALKKSLQLRKYIKVIKGTYCGVWPLPVMLLSLPVKTQPLPVTVAFTSGQRTGTSF